MVISLEAGKGSNIPSEWKMVSYALRRVSFWEADPVFDTNER